MEEPEEATGRGSRLPHCCIIGPMRSWTSQRGNRSVATPRPQSWLVALAFFLGDRFVTAADLSVAGLLLEAAWPALGSSFSFCVSPSSPLARRSWAFHCASSCRPLKRFAFPLRILASAKHSFWQTLVQTSWDL